MIISGLNLLVGMMAVVRVGAVRGEFGLKLLLIMSLGAGS